MRTAFVLASALLLFGSAASAAGNRVYRWVDPQGHVHYADEPPASENQSATLVTPQVPELGNQQGAAAPAAAADGEASAEACGKEKEKLAAYSAAQNIKETDALGNTHEYTSEERAKLLKMMADKVQKVCGGSEGQPSGE